MTKNLLFAICIVTLIVVLQSCVTEERQLLRKAERVLPGDWIIESMQVDPSPVLVLNGANIITDTVLYDVGRIHIPDFSADSLDIGIELRPLNMNLLVKTNEMKVNMDRLFITAGEEYFIYLRKPETVEWVGDEGAFITSTQLFHRNHVMEIINDNHIEFAPANGELNQRVVLIRE